jgi:Tfp pilus assembly protein PilP
LGNVAPAPTCTSGKRCLAIPELILQGTVKDVSGKMLAVVSNSSHRTYFLRENDQVFNGGVEKITSDSIVFREFVKDALGGRKEIGPDAISGTKIASGRRPDNEGQAPG